MVGCIATILFVHALRLADLFEERGVGKPLANYYRQTLFEHSVGQFSQLVAHPSQLSQEIFSLRKLIMRYWNNKSFRNMLWTVVKIRVSQSRAASLKRLIEQ